MKFSNAQLLNMAMSAKPAVRRKFANSMNEPLKYGRDYQSVMRAIFQVDKDEASNISFYDADFYDMIDPKFISATSFTPVSPIDAKRVMVDSIELPLYLEMPKSKANRVRYNVQERMKQVITAQISVKEDQYLISLLQSAVTSSANPNTVISVAAADLSAEHISLAISQVEGDHVKIATNCVLHPSNAHFIRMFSKNDANGFYASPSYSDEVMKNGRKMTMWGLTFLFTTQCPKNKIYITAEPEYTGRVVQIQEIEMVPYDDEKNRTVGYVGSQEAGYLLHNVASVAGITLT